MRNPLEEDLLKASQKTSILAAAGMVADEWQERLITSKLNACVVCSRQAGKSTGAAALAAHTFYYQPGSLVLVVAPTEAQSSELLRRAKALLSCMPGNGGMGVSNATTRIESPMGSRIIALPGTDSSTRGYSPHLLIMDEAAYLPDDTIKAMMPSVAVTRGRIVMLSTPSGRVGRFFEVFAATEDQVRRGEQPSWEIIRVNCETPEVRARQGQEFIEMERQTRTQYDFAQEYLGEFLASDSAVYNPYSIDAAFTDDPPSVVINGGIE